MKISKSFYQKNILETFYIKVDFVLKIEDN